MQSKRDCHKSYAWKDNLAYIYTVQTWVGIGLGILHVL